MALTLELTFRHLITTLYAGVAASSIIAAPALAGESAARSVVSERVQIFAGDTGAYLGCLNCDPNAFDALRNPKSLYLARLKNEASIYRDRTGDASMCARLASRPPNLEIAFGNNPSARFIGKASLNKTLPGSVCAYDLEKWLAPLCAELERVCDGF